MRFNRFAAAFRAAVADSGLTQAAFAESAKISLALLTKMFRGEPVHRKSLRLVMDFFRGSRGEKGGTKARQVAAGLMTAYVRDIFDDLGVNDDEMLALNMKPDLLSKRHRTILSLFQSVSPKTILALYFLGAAAKDHVSLRNTLYSLAELACSKNGHALDPLFLRACIEVPSKTNLDPAHRSFELPGGSLGEIMLTLADEE